MSKRANNEGSIYKRQDGRWTSSITVSNGKRKSFYGKTKAEVSKKLRTAQQAQDKGLPLPDDRLIVGKYIQDWLEGSRGRLKPTTWHRYELDVRLRIIPNIGKIRLAQLLPEDLDKLYAKCLTDGLSPRSVVHLHRIISLALKTAEERSHIARNVARLVKPPRIEKKEMQALTKEQASMLLDAAQNDRLSALYNMAIGTGLRQGELLGLKWQDIEWNAGTLQVRRSLQRTKGGLKLGETKTPRSRRMVKLPKTALEALKRHRIAQNEERLRLGAAWQDNDLVFCTDIGTFIERGNLERRSFKPLLAKAELPNIRFHDLRHTAATLMLAAGLHPKIVSDTLGHSQISITLDLYSHVTPSLQAQAAEVMDAVLAR